MKISNMLLGLVVAGLFAAPPVQAGSRGNNECPVGYVSGLSLDAEFGPGTQELTRCIKRRHKVNVVVQLSQFCRDPAGNIDRTACTRPYGLGNITNMLNDYEITHGMRPGKDFEIVAVAYADGAYLTIKDESYNGAGELVTGRNQFEEQVQALMQRGVKFLFCQNTTRAFIASGFLPNFQRTGISATDQIIEGMEYVTGGVTAIIDFQELGYSYIQP
ncbi:MAG: DsrE family protein [Thiohalobacteraceae bacterium]